MTACCVENALIFYYKYLWVRTFRLGIFIIIKDILEACQRLQPFDFKKKKKLTKTTRKTCNLVISLDYFWET